MNILMFNFFNKEEPLITDCEDHFYNWFAKNISKEKADIKFLLYEKIYNENLSKNIFGNIDIKPLNDSDIEYIFNDKLTLEQIYEKVHFQNMSKSESDKLKIIYENKFGEWVPDIIVCKGYYSSVKIWGKIFPQALCLSQENAIFSRAPFYRTLGYEPYSHVINTSLLKYRNEINNFAISVKDNFKLEIFKRRLVSIITNNSPIKREIKLNKKMFKKWVLLPLTGDAAYTMFKESLYGSSSDMVDYIMSKIPDNIGVFVTQHDIVPTLTDEDIKNFETKYPNFVYLKNHTNNIFINNSLYYFSYIDAVLNLTSNTGLFALLYNKPVLSLVKTYNDWFKDGQGIEELEKVLNQPKKNKNNILYWYLTHYILFEKDFYKEDFLYNYLKEKLEKYRKDGINFEYFNKINDIDDITEYTMDTVKGYYKNIEQEKIKMYILKLKRHITQLKQYFMQKIVCVKLLLTAIIKIMRLYIC